MGKVLRFERVDHSESEHVEHDGDAQLVMFTGVRYERHEPDEDDKPVTPPRRKTGG